ncbi:MAG TPA: hypothetical protein VGA18_08335 [Rhodothermales bacterium]
MEDSLLGGIVQTLLWKLERSAGARVVAEFAGLPGRGDSGTPLVVKDLHS